MAEPTKQRGRTHPEDMINAGGSQQLHRSARVQADTATRAEYAWEFLRRNRYYQVTCDDVGPAPHPEHWGFSPSPSYRRQIPLRTLKPYWETYNQGSPPRWIAVERLQDRFYENILKSEPFALTKSADGAKLNLQEEQVAVVFDLAEFFGQGNIGLQAQADLAVKYLHEYMRTRAAHWQKKHRHEPYPNEKEPVTPMQHSTRVLRGYLDAADEDINVKKSEFDYDQREGAYDFVYGWRCLELLTDGLKLAKPPAPKKTSR